MSSGLRRAETGCVGTGSVRRAERELTLFEPLRNVRRGVEVGSAL
jgi:hypothetical protein